MTTEEMSGLCCALSPYVWYTVWEKSGFVPMIINMLKTTQAALRYCDSGNWQAGLIAGW